jgi:hypothetical protein
MTSSLILLVISGAVFSLLAQTQRSASYQTEKQAVIGNTRIAMDTVERIIRQAGNDPHGTGFPGIAVVGATEVRVRSDLTGSAAASGFPDKGDPDGDTLDTSEDVTIRFNAINGTIELVPNGAAAQPIANYISGFQMQYLDAAGAPTNVGDDVRRIRVAIIGATAVPDPQTKQVYSVQVTSDIQLATRQ